MKLITIKKTKCKMLDMGADHLQYQYRIRIEWAESSPEEKDLGILVDEKLNITQQCVLAAQNANCTLGCMKRVMASKWMVVILPLYSALLRPHLEYYIQLRCSQHRKFMDLLGPEEGEKNY
ncbi:hypothetical protein HGM15179_007875 [Zosterops borbonicus]|uniref:Uncharacterized protein n=1 Tax=Zosterops borbonicus TaxID=364589 RepID=A0A8K1LMG1_9PASS|nr:hypothetical protein HGM15179_007875 [Zosterops borbonicus]